MINRYFNIVHEHRLNKGNWISRKRNFIKISKYLDEFSPTYDDLLEIVQFVKILETAFFYPNRRNAVFYKDHQCSLIAEMTKQQHSITIIGNPMLGVEKSRIESKIILTEERDDKFIEIQVIDTESKKAMTKIKFKDGTYVINEPFEEHLFMSIVDNLSISIKLLLEVYCYNLIHQ